VKPYFITIGLIGGLKIQEFDFEVNYKKRSDLVVPDALNIVHEEEELRKKAIREERGRLI
ncbi:hypothetical protein H311_02119, partial [Anncaliia algerae PRA109]